jgi:hypothetical protein
MVLLRHQGRSWICLYSTALRTRLTLHIQYVTGGFSPHIRFGGFLLLIPPRLNATILQGLFTTTNYYNAVLHSTLQASDWFLDWSAIDKAVSETTNR